MASKIRLRISHRGQKPKTRRVAAEVDRDHGGVFKKLADRERVPAKKKRK